MLVKTSPRSPCLILRKRLTFVVVLCAVAFLLFTVSMKPHSISYSLDLLHPEQNSILFDRRHHVTIKAQSTVFLRAPDDDDKNTTEQLYTVEDWSTSTSADNTTHARPDLRWSNSRRTAAIKVNLTAGSGSNIKKNDTENNRNDTSKSKKVITTLKDHPTKYDKELVASGKFVPVDLMTEGPFKFLPDYKNPCWINIPKNKSEPPVKCLPYFFLIGAPKSGTTDLFNRLQRHPEVSNFLLKEPHWIARRHYYGMKIGRSDLSNYLKFFYAASREIFMKKDKSGYHKTIIGDFSASTMWDNDYWTILPQNANLTQPKYTNADYIYHLNPSTRILAILRNPVDRLYSDYLYFNKNGSPESFHNESVTILRDFNGCLESNSLRECIYKPQHFYSTSAARLRIGVYHVHLKEYLRVFPRERILVLRLEYFSNNTLSSMNRVFSFLDLSPVNTTQLRKIADPNKHANARRKKDREVGEMLPQTRKMLQEFYQPHNEELVKLLGNEFDYNR